VVFGSPPVALLCWWVKSLLLSVWLGLLLARSEFAGYWSESELSWCYICIGFVGCYGSSVVFVRSFMGHLRRAVRFDIGVVAACCIACTGVGDFGAVMTRMI